MPKIALHKVTWETEFDRLVAFQSRERVDAVYTRPGNRKSPDAWTVREHVDRRERFRRPHSSPALPWSTGDIRDWMESQGCTVRETVFEMSGIKRYRVAPGLTDDQMLAFKLRFQ